jgi:PAS domain S-box-containing protein
MVSRNNARLFATITCIIICGICLSVFAVQSEDRRLRDQILTETFLAVSGLNTDQILTLSASKSDLSFPPYIDLKEQMMRIRSSEPLCRFAYIMGRHKDGMIFFYVDSEPQDSPDYSPPGQEYPESTPSVKKAFSSGETFVSDPDSDRWGTWVSGLSPLTNPADGEIFAVFGMDIDASNWSIHTASAAFPVLSAMLLIIVVILTFEILRRRSEKEKNLLSLSEEALRESEARLDAIIKGTPALQFVIDREHRVVSWNRALEEYSGIFSKTMIGTKNHRSAFFEDKRPLLADIILDQSFELLPVWYQDRVHQSPLIEGAFETTNFYPRMGKEGKWLHVLSAPVRNSGGDIIGALETAVDVTDQHMAEDALNEAIKKLNLLSSITRHDILNKITFLRGLFVLLLEKSDNQHELDILLRRGTEAVIFIQRQIEFTRTYQDVGMNKPEWHNLEKIIRKAYTELPYTQIAIIIDFEGGEVYSDPLIQKVFYNLMENSAKHGERVTTIRYSLIPSEEGIVIRYQDDGIGIPPEDKENIFILNDKTFY